MEKLNMIEIENKNETLLNKCKETIKQCENKVTQNQFKEEDYEEKI